MEWTAIAGLVLLFGLLIGLLSLIAAPIVLALFIVGLALKLVFFILFLLFRLVGALFGMGFSALGWLMRGLLLCAGLVFLLLLGVIPLLPLLIIAGGVYLVFRGMRSRSAPVGHA